MTIALTPESLVNVFTAGDQNAPSVAALTGGGYVAVWVSTGQNGSGRGLVGQRYSDEGQRVGGQFFIEDVTLGDQTQPDITGLTNGGFAVTWRNATTNTVRVKMFDAAGAEAGPEAVVSQTTYSTQDEPAIAALAGGQAVVVRSYVNSTTFTTDVYARLIGANGQPSGDEFLVTNTTAGTQDSPDVARTGTGFVVVWANSGDSDIYARRFSAAGVAQGAEFKVNTATAGTQDAPQVAALNGGRFVVVWESSTGDASGTGIRARLFEANGTAVGDEFLVNTSTESTQSQPSVTATADGGFFVAWYSNTVGSSYTYDVLGQQYDANGAAVGGETRLNQTVAGTQSAPAVAGLTGGPVVALWQSDTGTGHGDGSGDAVFQRLVGQSSAGFAPQAAPVLDGIDPVRVLAENALNAAPQIIDASGAAAVSDADSTDFAGGSLRVSRLTAAGEGFDFGVEGTQGADIIGIRSQGNAAGQIGVSGSSVRFGGVTIGTITSDGSNGADLVVSFNASATAAAVEALVENLTYRNLSDDPAAEVQLTLYLEDGDGGAAVPQVVRIQITAETDAFGAIGAEAQVNSYTPSTQDKPDVAALAGGGHVVVWESESQDGSSNGVYAQRYAADGSPVGAEFRVNTSASGSQQDPVVTALSTGGFVVAWYNSSAPGQAYIQAQRFAADGSAVGAEFKVNTEATSTQYQPAATALAGGAFVITWASYNNETNSYDIRFQRYDGAGAVAGAETTVNTTTASTQDEPAIATLGGGGFVVVWTDTSGADGSGQGIYGRRFNATGVAQGGEFRVNTATAGTQNEADVAALADGGFVVVWTDQSGTDGSGYGVFGQRYAANGTAVGTQFLVNEITSSTQYQPSVVGLPDGGFAVAFAGFSHPGGSSYDVYVQRYAASGLRVDEAVRVNADITGNENAPRLDVLANGDLIVAWEGDDASGSGVFQRVVGNPANYPAATDAPILDGLDPVIVLGEAAVNAGPVVLDGAVAVADLNSPNFAGGRLRIERVDAADSFLNFPGVDGVAQDVLGIRNQGNGAGQIGVSGANVRFGGTNIGTIESQGAGQPLSVLFNANATAAAVEALIENLTYTNPSNDPAASRQLRVTLSDGDGGAIVPQVITLQVAPQADADGPLCGESQVNTYISSTQDEPRVAALAGGGHVVVWQSFGQDGSGWGVYGQRLDAAGQPAGTEFRVNTSTSGNQQNPVVAGLSDGSFVVAWYNSSAPASAYIQAQRFAADGTALGAEFKVNTTAVSTQYQPALLGLPGGGFVVAWTSWNSGYDIRFQRYDNGGVTQGGEVVANTTTASTQDQPAIAATGSGFVVVWTDQGGADGSGSGVYGQRFSAAGVPQGGEFRVNTTALNSQYEPSVASLEGGGFVVVWRADSGQDGSAAGVYGQRYDSAGAAAGGEFLVNEQIVNNQYQPRVVGLPGGGFAVTYIDDNSTDGSSQGVYLQRYAADGTRLDGAVQVNIATSSTQWQPDLALTADDVLAVVWAAQTSGTSGDGSSYGVFQRLYGDPATAPAPASAAPVIDGFDESVIFSVGEIALPQIIDDAVLVSDADSANFNGGRLELRYLDAGALATDQLGVANAGQITRAGNTVSFAGTAIGTVDAALNGVNGAALSILFNTQATPERVRALTEALTFHSTAPAAVDRTLGLTLSDGDGGRSLARQILIDVNATVSRTGLLLGDVSGRTLTEAQARAGVVIDPSVDFEDFAGTPFTNGALTVSYVSAPTSRPGAALQTLSVQNQGNGTDQIGLAGTTVSYAGTAIGTIDAANDGQAGRTLRIVFNANATGDAIDSLIEAITWRTASGGPAPTVSLRFAVTNQAGNTTGNRDLTLTITPEDNGGPKPLGGEDQVNSHTPNRQETPALASLEGGGHVAVWMSYDQDSQNTWGVYQQRFDASGAPVGGEQLVAETVTGTQYYPRVAGLADGGWAVAWVGDGPGDASGTGIFFRVFDEDGNAGAQTLANFQTSSTQDQAWIAALEGGGFVVAWASETSAGAGDGNGRGVIGRVFSAAGAPVTNEFVINTFTNSTQQFPTVTGLPGGGFVAAWSSYGQDAANTYGAYAQRFSATGVKVGPEIAVNTAVTASNQYASDVIALTGGGFVVVFVDDSGSDGSGWGVYLQRYDANGNALGGNVLVNEVINSTQYEARAVALSTGGFIVAWSDANGTDGSGWGVFGQAFDAAGNRIDGVFQINEETSSTQNEPALAALPAGTFVAAWTSTTSATAGDGDSNGVFQRRFGDPATALTSADPTIQGLNTVRSIGEAEANAGPVPLDLGGAVAVGDTDSANFNGGILSVTRILSYQAAEQFAAPDNGAQDVLSLATGGRVSLVGTTVQVDGQAVGTLVSTGAAGSALTVAFNTVAAITDRVEAVLRAVQYQNPSNDPEATRQFRVTLSDGDGGTAEPVIVTVNVTPQTDGAVAVDDERQVNSFTSGSQNQSAAAGLTGGGHVVVWTSVNQDNPGENNGGIFAQRFDESGQPVGPEFQVNDFFAGAQVSAKVVGLSNGGFAVAWEGPGATDSYGVQFKIYDADGNAVVGETRLNADISGSEYEVWIAAGNGGFLAAWRDSNGDGNGDGIRARVVSNAGVLQGAEQTINTFQTSTQFYPSVAATTTGYVVTWSSYGQDSVNTYGAYGQRLDASGTKVGGEFRINTAVTGGNQYAQDVAGLTGGGFVALYYEDSGLDGSGVGVYGQLYDAAGNPVGGNFLVNEIINSTQSLSRVAALETGGFVVVWADPNGLDGSGWAVVGQQYDAQGRRVDGQFVINQQGSSTQDTPDVAGLFGKDGAFVVTWQSATSGTAGDGSGDGVFQRLFGDPAAFDLEGRPVLQALNATVTYRENVLNAGPQLIDANAAVALSDIDTAAFDGGFVRVDPVTSARGYIDQINAPDDLTQDQFGLAQRAGITITGTTVQVNGVAVGTIVQDGQAGRPFEIALNANATVAVTELLVESLTYRNISDDPIPTRLVRVQVGDGTGKSSDPQLVTIVITPDTDGASRVFGERQANTYETSTQNTPHVAGHDNGFVMVWQSSGQDGSGSGIYGQRFGLDGEKIGDEFRVNTTVAGTQLDPRVDAFADGRFVVTWYDQSGNDGSSYGVYMQRYNANGTTAGGETVVNQTTASVQGWQDVTVLADGSVVVVWEASQTGSTSYDVYGRVFNGTTGAPLGGEFKINSFLSGNQDYPVVTATADGGFTVAWESPQDPSGSSSGVYAQRFVKAGANYVPAAQGEFRLNTYTPSTQSEVQIAGLRDGGFVAVWQSNDQDGSSWGVFAQILDAGGNPVGEEFRVNDERNSTQYQPAVAALDSGGFVVAWSSWFTGADNSSYGVFAQQYDASGARIDSQILVNTEISGNQDQPTVAGLPGGGFVVGWTSATSGTAGDGNGDGVFYQVFGNTAPVLDDITVNGTEDQTLVLPLSAFEAGFTDDDGQPLVAIRIAGLPTQGQLLLNNVPVLLDAEITAADIAAGLLTFVPPADFAGTIDFAWAGTDGLVYSGVAEANLVLAPVNDAPDFEAGGNGSVQEGATFSRTMSIGDPDFDTYTITVNWGDGSAAQVFNTTDKTPTINRAYAAEGVYTVTVTVNDNSGTAIAEETDSFQVTVGNAAPVARDDFFVTGEDTAVSANLFASNGTGADSDPGSDPFTVTGLNGAAYVPGTVVTLPSGATVSITAAGTMVYNPAPGFQSLADGESAQDSFTYAITDNGGLSDTATVFVTVNGADDVVVAGDDTLTVDEDSAVSGSLFADTGDGPDFDPEGDAITVVSVQGSTANIGNVVVLPGGGRLTVQADGSFSFDAAGQYEELGVGESTVVSFDYVVREAGAGLTAGATAQITITGVNDAPVAADNVFGTAFNTAINSLDPRSGDFDPDGDPLTITGFTQPATGGTVSQNTSGTLRFVPTAGFFGAALFQYTVSDGNGGSDTASVTINVAGPSNTPPDAVNDTASTAEDTAVDIAVLLNDTDAESHSLSITSFGQGSNGSVAQVGAQLRYTPNANFFGTDSFVYTISDGNGGFDTATVTVTVNAVNDLPVVVPLTAAFGEDQTGRSLNLLAGATDPEGQDLDLTTVTVTAADGRTVARTVDLETGLFTLADGGFDDLAAGQTLTVTVTFNVTDGIGSTPNSAVLTITGANDAPVGTDDTPTTPEDTPVTIVVLANDNDIDSGSLAVSAVTQPANGTVVINADETVTYTPNANFFGTDSFTYTVTDGEGGSSTATVTVTVTPVNDAPVVVPVAASFGEDQTGRTVGLLAGASDVENDDLDVSGITVTAADGRAVDFSVNAETGVLSLADGGFEDLDSGETLAVTVTYGVTDGIDTTPNTATITINGANDAPVVAPVTASFGEDQTGRQVALLAGATDVDVEDLDVSGVTVTAADGRTVGFTVNAETGVLSLADGGFEDLDSGETLVLTVSYGVTDGTATTPNTATITINGANDAPVVVPVTASFGEDETGRVVNLFAGATDVDVEDLDLSGFSLTAADGRAVGFTVDSETGLLSLADGGFDDLAAGENLVLNVAFGVTDGTATTPNTGTITIEGTNDAPDGVNDSYSTAFGAALVVATAQGVLANDSDVDGDTLTVAVLAGPANGTLALAANGGFTYTPNAGFSGPDGFTYTVSDGKGGTDTASVAITVLASGNNAPVAGDDTATTRPGVTVNGNVLTNDSDPDGDPLTVVSFSNAANGSVTMLTDGSFGYTSDAGFRGTDSFTYTVIDGFGGTDTATVTVTVVNDDPLAEDDTATTRPGVTVNGNVLTNDSDPDSDPLTVVSFSNAANGSVTMLTDGSFGYTSDAGFRGTDSFTYTVIDGFGGTDTATVTVTVVNDDPLAEDDTATTRPGVTVNGNVLTNDSDPDSDPLTVVSFTNAANGSVTMLTDGSFGYTSDAGFRGTDSFTYTVIDGFGGTDTATVTVTVVNDDPLAEDDSFSTPFQTALTTGNLLTNDSDPDSDPLTVVSFTNAANGSVTVLADGSFTYTPDAAFIGLDSFTYSVIDGFGGTATATAVIAVQAPGNSAPVAEDDTASTRPGEAVAIAVLDNDSDADNNPLTVSPIAGPANGTLSVDAEGVVTYTPDAGFRGTDSFDYQLSDGQGGIDTATVVINVFNTDPDAVDDDATTDAGTPVLIAVLDNDTDDDGDNLFVSTVTGPANGSLVLGANGVYTYTPNAGFSGTDSFVYAVNDGYGGTDTATVTVDVEAESLNLVIGTSRTATLRGTADADAIIAGAAPIMQMYGEEGPDVFVFGLHAGNGQRNTGYIRDFDLTEDFIDLAGATVASHFTLAGSTYMTLAGADRDVLVVNGITDYNSLTTRFIDDWPGRADALFA